jgi:TolB-like protein/Tfp pilus assembly protein PilF/predicted Ser/Thr protein kinase
MIGKTLGHYRIMEKLGEGGMGVVFRAHDEQLDRDVALKVLPAATLADESARARLLREARAAAALNHPNICTIHEVGEADGQAYIAMEYVKGQPLSELVASQPLPVEEVLRYGQQIAGALGHAHQQGIVHRDLKSANVVITPEGRAKVLDFGLAKRLSGEELAEATTQSQASLTQPGALVGTLPYMAPEQLRGQPADARSDVWALGVVLHEMAAGSRPFQGQTGYELSSAILSQPPGPLPARVPVELRAIIERCLVKEPAQRYQRAAEVRAALEAIATGAAERWLKWKYLAKRRWFRAAAGVASVVLLLAMLVGLNVGGLRDRLLGPATPKIESIAVLPLANLSGDPEQDYFAAGMHEALVTDLARLRSFRKVIARASVIRYRNTDKPLRQIAQELGVEAIITGAVLREGDRVRITAQLINPATEENLWAARYERPLRGVLSLQNEIVAAIAREIQFQLTPQEQVRLASARPVNPEAYELYLKGQFYVNKFTPEEFQRGVAYLHQAVGKDPTEPLAYAGLALAYAEGGHMLVAPPQEAFPQARAAALKALELDDTLAEAYTALAMYVQYYSWDWPAAEQAFRRALELNPNFAQAHQHHGWYLRALGHPEEAVAELKRAKELDPLKPLFGANLAYLYSDAGQYDQAIDEAQKVLELDPNFPVGLLALGVAYAGKGMYNEAIATHQRLAAADPAWKLDLARTYALAGQPDETRHILAGLKDEEKDPWMLATVYVALGDKNEAMRWLEAAYQARHQFLPYTVYGQEFAPLRDDARFRDLMRRINFPE